MKNKNRYYAIDAMRFCAAMSVLLFHYMFRGFAADNLTSFNYATPGNFIKYGYLGVDLFFMISGFVILMTASRGTAKNFVASRVARLYPAFWVCCSLTAIIVYLYGEHLYSISMVQYLANLTMLSGFIGVKSVDGVYATLFVEMRFYFLIFVVLLLGQLQRTRYLMGAWLILAIIAPLFGKTFSYLLLHEHAQYFIAGAMMYIISVEGISGYSLCIVGASFITALIQAFERAVEMQLHYGETFSLWVIAMVLAVSYLSMFLAAMREWEPLHANWVMMAGAVTYPLYLLHQNIGYVALNVFKDSINKHVLIFGLILFMLGISWLVNISVEKTLGPRLRRLTESILAFNKNR